MKRLCNNAYDGLLVVFFLGFLLWSNLGYSYDLGEFVTCTGFQNSATTQYKMKPTGQSTQFDVGDTIYFFTELKDINVNFRMGVRVYKDGVETWEEFNQGWNDIGQYGWQYSYYYPSIANTDSTYVGNYSAEVFIDTGDGFVSLGSLSFEIIDSTPTPTPANIKKVIIPFLVNIDGWDNKIAIRNTTTNIEDFSLNLYSAGSLIFSQNYSLNSYEFKEITIGEGYDYGEITGVTDQEVISFIAYTSTNSGGGGTGTNVILPLSSEVGNNLLVPSDKTGFATWSFLLISNSGDTDEVVSLSDVTTGSIVQETILSHSNIIILEDVGTNGIKIDNTSGEKNLQGIFFSGNDDLSWLRVMRGLIFNP